MLDLTFQKMVVTNPQHIDPVVDNPTIALKLSADVSYQSSMGIVFVCIVYLMFNLIFICLGEC
jgi:hypothetical protein